ncbi:uncharacterized protein K452DRAFT_345352 [Aplosporella prunicola CBS 121167]|uniref:Extracellular membrane protein CFEM domain-containing protein n=1 Tax=Aplosporella prunicola CBS 121167 TaxID=1176127 RepID=A0A6A6BK17_9PEZI|nr:uncharacterized protein K452DRAFT_345352 [Aplosporella prunicola CBS 121167]KAF2143978.1 hypothetical protein K452DRAFT_345352 [Aplosporella prunicola CBS 121167]
MRLLTLLVGGFGMAAAFKLPPNDATPNRGDLAPCLVECIDAHYDYPFWTSGRKDFCANDWKSQTYKWLGYTVSPCSVHQCLGKKEAVKSFQDFMFAFCGRKVFGPD